MTAKKDAQQAKEELTTKKKPKRKLSQDDLLSTGSTVLNLALSGHAKGGLYAGHYYWLVGDSDTGKTVQIMTIFAEASINPRFKDHRLIFDDPELGMLMDVKKMYGKALAARIEPPAGTRANPINSSTVEDFYENIDDAFAAKTPFIYVLDSMDAIETRADAKKREQQRAAKKKGEDAAGSFGMDKAKKNAAGMRGLMAKIKKSASVIIVVSQLKANTAVFSREKKSAGGGLALKYFAAAQIWCNPKGKVETTYQKKKYEQGIKVKVRVRKNRLTGRKSDLILPILWSVGIDDIGSCVDYLVDVGHWTADKGYATNSNGKLTAPEFGGEFRRNSLVTLIETENKEEELRSLVESVWHEIQAAITIERKRRYQ